MNPLSSCLVFGVVLCATIPSTRGVESPPAPAPENEVIVLPKYDVTTDRVLPPMKRWKYVSVPGYEILSDASEVNTKRFVDDFHLLRQVAAHILPEARVDPSVPTYIVLCAKGNDFEHFVPASEKNSQGSYIGSRFCEDGERTAIVVDYTLDDGMGGGDYADAYHNFYLQYFRQLIHKAYGQQLPAWMETGLVELYAAVEFTDQGISLGKLSDARSDPDNTRQARRAPPTTSAAALAGRSATGYSDEPTGVSADYSVRTSATSTIATGSFNRALAERNLIPLKDFCAVPEATLANIAQLGGSYPAQAYLFAHMCLFGRGHRYQKGYYKLAQRATQGPITDEVFKECFGIDFKKMETEMRGYIEFADYQRIDYRVPKGKKFDTAPSFSLREATDAESGRIAGEIIRMNGQQDEALNHLIAPYARGERDPELLAALGLTELQAGKSDRARKFLEAAAKGKTTRARAYLELARLRAEEISRKAKAENHRIQPTDLKPVEEALLAGAECPPPIFELCDMLARLWHENQSKPTIDQFNHLMPGALKFSTRLGLIYRIAAIGVNCGYFEKSRLLIEHGLENAPNEAVKKEFAALAAKLPPAAPARK